MQRYARFPLLALVATFILLVSGCDRGQALEPITGDVVFGFVEGEPGEPGPAFALYIETVDIYPSRCPLWIRWDIGQKVDVEILGIDQRGLCFPSSGPSRTSIPFGVPEGTYDFDLRHRGQTDRYRLVVQGGEIAVETLSASVSCYEEDLVETEEGRFCEVDD